MEKVSPICREMLKKISKIELFPLLNDLVVYHKFSNRSYLPTKSHGLFMSAQLPSIEHEIAHTVEIPSHRITQPDWGISLETKFHEWSNKKFFSALAREIRVRSIESYLHDYKPARCDRLHSLIFANEVWWRELEIRLPYGRFNKYKDVIDWGHFVNQITLKEWNQERIIHEWSRRSKILNDWMETK